jgi:hypothetical protein
MKLILRSKPDDGLNGAFQGNKFWFGGSTTQVYS